jgi:hypothetical protein
MRDRNRPRGWCLSFRRARVDGYLSIRTIAPCERPKCPPIRTAAKATADAIDAILNGEKPDKDPGRVERGKLGGATVQDRIDGRVSAPPARVLNLPDADQLLD